MNEPWASRGADPSSGPPHDWPELDASHANRLRMAPPGSFLSGPLAHQHQPPLPFPQRHPHPHHLHHHTQQQQQQLHRDVSFELPPGSSFGNYQQPLPPQFVSHSIGGENVFGGPPSSAFPLGPPLPNVSGLLSSSPLDSGAPLHSHFGMAPPLPPPPPPLGMAMAMGMGLSNGSSNGELAPLGSATSHGPTGFGGFMGPGSSASDHMGAASQAFYHLQFQQQRHLQQQQQQQQQQQHELTNSSGFSSLQQSIGLANGRFSRPQQQQQQDAPPLPPPPQPQPSQLQHNESSQLTQQQQVAPSFDLAQSMLHMRLSDSSGLDSIDASRADPPLLSPPASALVPAGDLDPFASWASSASSSSTLRDEMNQQMAALYQRDSAALSHEALAPSGSALVGALNAISSNSSSDTGDRGAGRAFPDLPDLTTPIELLGAASSRMLAPHHANHHALNANNSTNNSSLHRQQHAPRRSPPPPHFRNNNTSQHFALSSSVHPDSAFAAKHSLDRESLPLTNSSSDGPSSSTIEVAPDVTKPNGNIKVAVSLLADECAPGRVLMVGLFRLGQATNERPIFVKQVLFENKLQRHYRFLHTRITFRAPRSPGDFAFRVFESRRSSSNQSHDDRDAPSTYSNATIAQSNRLKVTLEYAHFIETLRTTHDRFRSGVATGDVAVVISSLLALLRLVDLVETVFLHGNVLLSDFVDACLQLVSLRPSRVAALFAATDACPSPLESFHGTMRNVLNGLDANPFVKELVADDVLRNVDRFQRELYCHTTGLYFQTPDDRIAYWQTHLGLAPTAITLNDDARARVLASRFVRTHVSRFVHRDAAQLIPDAETFRRARQAIYNTVHAHVVARLPVAADLDVFGSSANDFGTYASDMDMCLVLAQPASSSDAKQQVLKLVVALLERQPQLFSAIDASRLTARIPIVMFRMVESGAECDLSVENVLAQRNTALLRAYANADPRVRVLAFVLKQFVKRRRMNAPFEGTLSSYGYLLMLIHFLQRQDPPVLPVLQALPPTWDGTRACDCTPDRVWCSLQSPQCALSERHVDAQLPSVCCRGPADDANSNSNSASVGTGAASVETYFFDPFAFPDAADKLALVAAFGARNTASVGELLVGFFEYFGLRFDSSRHVVSVRMARTLSKDEKKRANQWRMHTRLSIEDPFEVAYDVAHVLKGSRDKYIRQQFARAYTLLVDGALAAGDSSSDSDDAVDWDDRVSTLMTQLMEEVHDPPFLHSGNGTGIGAATGATAAAVVGGDDDSGDIDDSETTSAQA